MATRPVCRPGDPDRDARPVRHLLYGRRTAIYRISFDIQEASEEGPRVRVLRIWHGARDRIAAEDLETEH